VPAHFVHANLRSTSSKNAFDKRKKPASRTAMASPAFNLRTDVSEFEADCPLRAKNAFVFQHRVAKGPHFVQRVAIIAFNGPAPMVKVTV
jgi:hypothetical protein